MSVVEVAVEAVVVVRGVHVMVVWWVSWVVCVDAVVGGVGVCVQLS